MKNIKKTGLLVILFVFMAFTLFAGGAKEARENEKLIKVVSVSDDEGHLDITGELSDGSEIIYHTTDDTSYPLSMDSIKSGDYLIVKDTGIMTMSIPPQSTASSIRNVTIAVESGAISFGEKKESAPVELPSSLDIGLPERNELISMFNYSYGYLNATGLVNNDITVNAAYFARGIIDSTNYYDIPPIYSIDKMNEYLTEYMEKYIDEGKNSEIGTPVRTLDEIKALEDPSGLEENFAYSYGYLTTLDLLGSGLDILGPIYAQGFLTALYGIEPLESRASLENYIYQYSDFLEEQYEAYMAELAKANADIAKAFLEENGKREGVTTLPSGVELEIVMEDSELGATPTESDSVIVNYELRLINGAVIDQGQNVTFSLGSLIPGFVDACVNMKVGQTAIAYIPPELGYGENAPDQIGPNALLIFTIQLIGIAK